MTENDFLLEDRVQKIRQIDAELNLCENAYISYSGGKDSSALSALIDYAIPTNQIPRVYCNTGIEYNLVLQHVKKMAEQDPRITIIAPHKNIKQVLETYGYPFKSKEHAHKVHLLQIGSKALSVMRYFRMSEIQSTKFVCPKVLLYQRENKLGFPISDYCCAKLKKEPMNKWSKENKRPIAILGLRNAEGGQRSNVKNCISWRNGKVHSFSPLLPTSDSFVQYLHDIFDIPVCDLYKPPFNFRRTGCKGCPFALDLQEQLDIMSKFLPAEKKQCEYIFKPVYEEYRRIGYHLREEGGLFDETT